ncbi:MAG: CotH kinase family protein [Bacteroidales bacterium]|nr:CotH kinase family protein [Bacteroidales bacterium]
MHKSIVFVLALITILGCKKTNNISIIPEDIDTITCSNEKLSEDGVYILSDKGDIQFDKSVNRSDSFAYTGKYSVKLTKSMPYGFKIDIDSVKKNERIYVDFWFYGVTPMLVFTDNTRFYYISVNEVVEENDNGWKRISYKILAPGNLKDNKLRIYAWNSIGKDIYIDDLCIIRYPPVIKIIEPDMLVKIIIDTNAWKILEEKRIEAFEKGVLESKDADYVKMKMIYKGDTLKGKLRLKGDWLDHLNGDKWSYRIKLKSDYSWKGMKTFSLQTPASRSFMDEWVAHRLFSKEDVLTTRYGFVNVQVNGADMGLYAYEEHFDKYLVEYNKRREGPILKFVEDRFWLWNKLKIQSGVNYNIPTFEDCLIAPFKPNRTVNSPQLLSEYQNAQNLMFIYKNWEGTIPDLFNIDNLARYIALLNVTKGYHAISWHNQRFYYNPVLCSLEPIAFDCYTNEGEYDWVKRPIFGDFDSALVLKNQYSSLYYQYFLDPQFRDKYYYYLKKYSSEDYMNEFLGSLTAELDLYEKLLQEEFLYQYDTLYLKRNAEAIRNAIELKNESGLDLLSPPNVIFEEEKQIFQLIKSPEIPPYYISSYCQNKDSVGYEIKVVNDFSSDIFIIGYENKDKSKTYFRDKIKIGSINSDYNKRDIFVPKGTKSLLYKTNAVPDTFKLKPFRWKYPESISPRIELLSKTIDSNFVRFLEGKKVIIHEGHYTFKEPLIIPEGYYLEIEKGADLNFLNGSFLLSFSPVLATGSSEKKILIRSGDTFSKGFIVLQADGRSTLSNVIFDGLCVLDYKGWSLTGAVTFYESDVDISNVVFTNNKSEDALNIVRSDFTMSKCYFNNIFGDAFDSDFSTGNVQQSYFKRIANDAIDISTSEIDISNCLMKEVGDKGISGGEKSTLNVSDVFIYNANIAVASKDNSHIEIKNSMYESSVFGYAIFNKKSEYKGMATIITDNVLLKNVQNSSIVEKGSRLIEDGVTKEGTALNVSALFYP